MKHVQRTDLVDYQTYEDTRARVRERVLEEKAACRVHLGENLTFLFENTETVRYQIQEMMRIENIVREKQIQHEIDTYNDLLGDEGELGCTLLIEIDDPKERDVKLRSWLRLPEHLYLELANGERARASWDQRQVGDDRLSSVQYLKFKLGGSYPTGIGADHPALSVSAKLTEAQRAALEADSR